MVTTEMIIILVAMIPIALNYWGVIHTHFERSLLAILLMTGVGLWIVGLLQETLNRGDYSWGINVANAILITIMFVSLWVYRRSSRVSLGFLLWLYGGGAVVFGVILVLNFV